MGSTFAVELPIYSRAAGRHEAPDIESVLATMPPSSRPRSRPRLRATNVVQVVPASNAPGDGEGATSHGDTAAVEEGAAGAGAGGRGGAARKKQLSVLIVDDSSANRSADVCMWACLHACMLGPSITPASIPVCMYV